LNLEMAGTMMGWFYKKDGRGSGGERSTLKEALKNPNQS